VTYGVVVFVLLLFIHLHDHSMTYWAVYALLLAPILSLLCTLIFGRRLTVTERLGANYVTKGEGTSYTLTVKNRSVFPCTAVRPRFDSEGRGIEIGREENYFSVPPRGTHEQTVHIQTKYRGHYPIGVRDILLYDFLGLFRFRQAHSGALELTVRPRVLPINYLPLGSALQDALVVKHNLGAEDNSLITDLRKYQPTDGYKKIHWKASAKKNELISKQFQETEEKTAVMLLDNWRPAIETEESRATEDAMMEALVSVMAYVSGQGYRISLGAMGQSATAFDAGFDRLYREASDLRFSEGGDFDTYLEDYVRAHQNAMDLCVFTPRVTERLVAALGTLQHFGYNIILFYFDTPADDPQIKQLRESNIHCLDFREL